MLKMQENYGSVQNVGISTRKAILYGAPSLLT